MGQVVPVVTPIYAGLLALLYIALAIRVIRARRSAKVAVGTGGDRDLERAVRVHANFAEYAPLALLLVLMLELRGTDPVPLHGLGAFLVAARLVHAYGMSRSPEDHRFRVVGMATTLTVVAVAALWLVLGAVLA